MNIEVVNSDISKFKADALIYSTNQYFNLSGGVGKSLVSEYGDEIQYLLDTQKNQLGFECVPVGSVIECVASNFPWKRVFHVVATDLDYETDPHIVRTVLKQCFEECEVDYAVNSIAISALGCGYGSMKESEFLEILKEEYAPYAISEIFKVTLVRKP